LNPNKTITEFSPIPETGGNNLLFPVFLKMEELRLLIIGGGNIALEKLETILANSPSTPITLVAPEIKVEILDISREFTNLIIYEREAEPTDFDEVDLVLIAVTHVSLAGELASWAHERNLLVNVADTPELCDFYLSSIVRKGDLKIAISTNEKSPTIAKRLKEVLNDAIPSDTQISIEQLHTLRKQLTDDFVDKEKSLNEATAILIEKQDKKKIFSRRIRVGSIYVLSALALMITGHWVFKYIPLDQFTSSISESIDSSILWWILGGFLAQLVDGSLGMAYGVTTTTFLLSFGISPAIASASMHASEIFTTGTSSLIYLRYKNINGKLFRSLLIPGAIGAIVGACTVSLLKAKMGYVKPVVSVYTILLGILIIRKALGPKKVKKKKFSRIGPLAAVGGFLDSVGGGGWGPIVTTTLVAGGRDLRYSIGSAHAAKFFVALISTVTFFFMIGTGHWQIILGLVLGGMIAAPFSIWLSTRISVRNGLVLVGLLVIITSLNTIINFFVK
jgi:uncharacterized protein